MTSFQENCMYKLGQGTAGCSLGRALWALCSVTGHACQGGGSTGGPSLGLSLEGAIRSPKKVLLPHCPWSRASLRPLGPCSFLFDVLHGSGPSLSVTECFGSVPQPACSAQALLRLRTCAQPSLWGLMVWWHGDCVKIKRRLCPAAVTGC